MWMREYEFVAVGGGVEIGVGVCVDSLTGTKRLCQ